MRFNLAGAAVVGTGAAVVGLGASVVGCGAGVVAVDTFNDTTG